MNKRVLAALLLGASVVSTTDARNQSGIDVSNYTFSQEVPFEASIELHSIFPEDTSLQKTNIISTASNSSATLLLDSGEIDLSSFTSASNPLSICIDLVEDRKDKPTSTRGLFSSRNILLAGTVATTAAAAALYLWCNPSQAVTATSTALVPYMGNAAQTLSSAVQLIPAASNGLVSALTAQLTSVSAMIPALGTMLWNPTIFSTTPNVLTIAPSSPTQALSLATPLTNSVADAPSSALVTVAGQMLTSTVAVNTLSFYANLVTYAAKEGLSTAEAFSLIRSKNSNLAQFLNLEVVAHLVASNTPVEALPSVVALLPSPSVEAMAPAIDGSVSSFTFHPDFSVEVTQSSPKMIPSLATPLANSVSYVAVDENAVAPTAEVSVEAVTTNDEITEGLSSRVARGMAKSLAETLKGEANTNPSSASPSNDQDLQSTQKAARRVANWIRGWL